MVGVGEGRRETGGLLHLAQHMLKWEISRPSPGAAESAVPGLHPWTLVSGRCGALSKRGKHICPHTESWLLSWLHLIRIKIVLGMFEVCYVLGTVLRAVCVSSRLIPQHRYQDGATNSSIFPDERTGPLGGDPTWWQHQNPRGARGPWGQVPSSAILVP